jgi:hypothetical protein
MNTSDSGHDSADDLAEGCKKSSWLEKASNRECDMVRNWSRIFVGHIIRDHRQREESSFVWLPKPLLASGSDPPQHEHELGHPKPHCGPELVESQEAIAAMTDEGAEFAE